MFNNFVKSMMAICIVTSGWSTISSGRPRGLTQSKIDDFFSNGNKAAYSGDGKNSEIEDLPADENSEINTSNSSEASIEEDGIKKERNKNSSVQYGVINIISDRSDLNSSNSSGGSIEKVDVETQTIEEVKSPSTTSETMNELINTVDTLKIEGHSSGEEDGSGSDSFHYNKDADTSTFSEEATETKIGMGSIVDDKVDGLDVRDKISDLVNVISVAYRRFQRGQNSEYCKQRIREAINELNNLGAINVVSPDSYALFLVLSSSFDVWWNDSGLSQEIKNKFIAAASDAGFQVDAVQKWMLSILSNFGD